MAFFVYLLVRTGCAFAEEPALAAPAFGRERPDRHPAPGAGHRATVLSLPGSSAQGFLPPPWSDTKFSFADVAPRFQLPSDYSPREYRSFGIDGVRQQARGNDPQSVPALKATSAWERLADYKTRGGIRLLTLWNSKISSLSLQTGHGGMASIQWTSRPFGGGAGSATTRGVLDRLFATSIERFGVMRHALRAPNPVGVEIPADRRDN